jgi:type IV secretory pathway VirB10-like protein
MSDVKKTEFPASSANFLQKIPKPVLITLVVVAGSVLLLASWPRGKKISPVPNSAQQTAKTDDFEAQSPVKADPFSTKATNADDQGKSVLEKSSEYGQQTSDPSQDNQSAGDPDPKGRPGSGRPSINNRPTMPVSENSGGSYVPPAPVSGEITRRLDNSYQQMVQHFKGTAQMAVVAVTRDEYDKIMVGGNVLASVEPQMQNLSEDMVGYKNKTKITIPAGSRIRAVTLQEVNSDHPGYFTARVTSPSELQGYTLVCNAKGNAKDRIPVTVEKIVSPEGKEKASPAGEVQMNYAGLEGEITSHYFKRLLPPIASAFIGAGAGYLYYKAVAGSQNLNADGQRINTADGVIGPPYQVGVQGVQDEINRLGGDNPNTVIVPKGTSFEILVTEALAMTL